MREYLDIEKPCVNYCLECNSQFKASLHVSARQRISKEKSAANLYKKRYRLLDEVSQRRMPYFSSLFAAPDEISDMADLKDTKK